MGIWRFWLKRISSPCLASHLHLICLELSFADGDVPVASNLIKLSPAPLAFYSIVNRLARRLRRVEIRCSRPWRWICTHGSSELQTLNLPLWHAFKVTFLRRRSSHFRLLLGPSSIILIFKPFAARISWFTLLFDVKFLPFLNENLLTNLGVLAHRNRIKWPSTWIAL